MSDYKDYIQVQHVSKTFEDSPQSLEVLRDIKFKIKKGEFICIVGGSGCGKSTLLRAISGLDSNHEGTVYIDGEEIVKPGKNRGFVFQENRLFPWLSVEDNIKFALDAFTKMQLQDELINIKRKEKTTMIMITHDMEEAVYLADRIIVMGKGPGVIKDIVSVELPRPRNRNDYHFTELRKKFTIISLKQRKS